MSFFNKLGCGGRSVFAGAFTAFLLAGCPLHAFSNADALLTSVVTDALNSGAMYRDLPIETKTWTFPESRSNLVRVIVAVKVDMQPGDDLQGGEVAVRVAGADQIKAFGVRKISLQSGKYFTWTESIRLPAGPYVLGVAAVSGDGQRVGNHFYKFEVASPISEAPLKAASLLLTTRCQAADALAGERSDLFNPLVDGDCILVPEVAPTIRAGQSLRVLLRLYSGSDVSAKHFPEEWQAVLELRDSTGTLLLRKEVPLSYCSPRGWGAGLSIQTDKLALKPGDYRVTMAVSGPGNEKEYTGSDVFHVPGE